jgi:hypothetical protein
MEIMNPILWKNDREVNPPGDGSGRIELLGKNRYRDPGGSEQPELHAEPIAAIDLRKREQKYDRFRLMSWRKK